MCGWGGGGGAGLPAQQPLSSISGSCMGREERGGQVYKCCTVFLASRASCPIDLLLISGLYTFKFLTETKVKLINPFSSIK